jgi:hypothetical protein
LAPTASRRHDPRGSAGRRSGWSLGARRRVTPGDYTPPMCSIVTPARRLEAGPGGGARSIGSCRPGIPMKCRSCAPLCRATLVDTRWGRRPEDWLSRRTLPNSSAFRQTSTLACCGTLSWPASRGSCSGSVGSFRSTTINGPITGRRGLRRYGCTTLSLSESHLARTLAAQPLAISVSYSV